MRQQVKGLNTLNGVRKWICPELSTAAILKSRRCEPWMPAQAPARSRKYQLSPKLLERWRGEWRARGEAAFPGIGRRVAGLPTLDDTRRIADLERKIGQLTMENDFLKKALQHFRDHHPPAVVNGADVCLKKSVKPPRKGKR